MNVYVIHILSTLCLIAASVAVEPPQNDEKSKNDEETKTLEAEEKIVAEILTSAEKMTLSMEKMSEDELMKMADRLQRVVNSDEDGVAIWKMENGDPHFSKEFHYKDFESDKAYVVLEVQKYFEGVKSVVCDVFYWIGERCSAEDAGEAAAAAMIINFATHSLTILHREVQGRESPAFKEAFAREEARALKRAASRQGEPGEVEWVREDKTMFLLRKSTGSDVGILEVKLSRLHTEKNDICIVLTVDSTETVYVYCGEAVTQNHQLQSVSLAKDWLAGKGPDAKLITIFRNNTESYDEAKLAAFFKEFERPPIKLMKSKIINESETKKLEEARNVLIKPPENTEKCDLTIIRIHKPKDGQPVQEIPVKESRIYLHTGDSYVLDTCSDWGLLVWMGRKSSDIEREHAARKAELYLREKNYDYTTPITFVKEDDLGPPPVYSSEEMKIPKPDDQVETSTP